MDTPAAFVVSENAFIKASDKEYKKVQAFKKCPFSLEQAVGDLKDVFDSKHPSLNKPYQIFGGHFIFAEQDLKQGKRIIRNTFSAKS